MSADCRFGYRIRSGIDHKPLKLSVWCPHFLRAPRGFGNYAFRNNVGNRRQVRNTSYSGPPSHNSTFSVYAILGYSYRRKTSILTSCYTTLCSSRLISSSDRLTYRLNGVSSDRSRIKVVGGYGSSFARP